MENIKEKLDFEVSSEYEGMRLDKYLSEQIEEATRSYLEKLIDNNFVKVNSKIINKNGRKLKLGEKIEVLIPEEENIDIEPENIPLDVIYENEDFIVINKSYGMVVHPAYGNYSGTLVNALLYYTNNLSSVNGNIRPGIIHRLDKDTDGLMIIAKTERWLQHFKTLFKEKSESDTLEQKDQVPLKKWYRATCEISEGGNEFLKQIEGKLPFIISEEVKAKVPNTVPKLGITQIEKIEKKPDGKLQIFLQIFTGRTHQIRYHLSSHGLPIYGDYLYGREAEIPMQLTAYQLEFKDLDGEMVRVKI